MDHARGVVKLPSDTRELVQRRAQGACEYCHIPQDASILPHLVDHIIGRQHRGSDDVDSLCLCCIRPNLKKGPNIASIDPESKLVVQLCHPRRHAWREHFVTESNGIINGLTAEGRATVQLLDMNDSDRVRLRAFLLRRGRHP
ncbi:HNH endonuclease [Sorangium sp. So ce385]|uniref:HNH endonuclease n=1 Tax=Sorangium sp. So ce385 TaxID=3133308 RepID=UPI003F5B576F